MMDALLARCATIQSSWLGTDTLVVKYEDLIADEYGTFEEIISYCQIPIKSQCLYEIVASNSFKATTGRQRGQENINEHQRKGVAGDWQNHFTPLIKDEFKCRFGDLLIESGYEKNMDW